MTQAEETISAIRTVLASSYDTDPFPRATVSFLLEQYDAMKFEAKVCRDAVVYLEGELDKAEAQIEKDDLEMERNR